MNPVNLQNTSCIPSLYTALTTTIPRPGLKSHCSRCSLFLAFNLCPTRQPGGSHSYISHIVSLLCSEPSHYT